MNWNDENGDGGAFGQAFQRQFKRSIGVPGEPSMAPEGQMGIAPLRGPKGGYRPPTPQAFQVGGGSPMIPARRTDLHRPPPPQAFMAAPGNTGFVPPNKYPNNGFSEVQFSSGYHGPNDVLVGDKWLTPPGGPGGFGDMGQAGNNRNPYGGKGPGGPANPWDNDMDYMRSLGWFDNPMPQIGPDGNIVPIHRREASLEDYNRWKANQGRELVPEGGPNNPKWAYFDGPNGPDGRPMDTVPTENPIGLGYAPDAQNDMAGLALRGYYRDENNNWQMRPNPNRAPAPGRSNGRPMGAPPAPPPMPIPPGTGGLDPVGPGGGLGGPQGRDRMPGNFAAQPPQTKTPDNGWQWGDLNNLTNRWKG